MLQFALIYECLFHRLKEQFEFEYFLLTCLPHKCIYTEVVTIYLLCITGNLKKALLLLMKLIKPHRGVSNVVTQH